MKRVIYLNKDNFAELLKNSVKPVLIDFWAPWCAPCRAISPILDDISEREDVIIAKLDVEANPEIAQQYGIRSIPTMMLFQDGEKIAVKMGAGNKDQINDFIDNNI